MTSWNGHGVVQVFPSERDLLLLQRRQILIELATSEGVLALGKSVIELLEVLVFLLVHQDTEVVGAQLEELDSEDLKNHEEKPEANEDTEVSPDVSAVVRVTCGHVA